MGKNTKIFEHAELGIRIVQSGDNGTWFVAEDICRGLGIKYTHISIGCLDEDEWTTSPDTDAKGRIQDKFIINESGMYSLILRSRKPEAKKCRKWVTSEVLPIIRKHGIYATENMVEKMLSDPSTMIKTLERLRDEHEKRVEAEKAGSDSFY